MPKIGMRSVEARHTALAFTAAALLAATVPTASAFAQAGKAAVPPSPPPASGGNEAGARDLLAGKRMSCRQDARAKGLRGEDVGDDVAICLAAARLDCTKKAVAAKARGQERSTFMRDCMAK